MFYIVSPLNGSVVLIIKYYPLAAVHIVFAMIFSILPSGNAMFYVDSCGQSKYKNFGGFAEKNYLVLN